ncbi:MAG: hypothetical protein GY811_21800 [Myxococcales bacterium]|nr:hypothetical protein [Myxococcales bacterium]
MARKKKLRKTKSKKRQPKDSKEAKEARRLDSLASDTTATFTCSTQLIADFTRECERIQEEGECDLLYNHLAIEIWNERPDLAPDIVDALTDLTAERERHLGALGKFAARFEKLATTTPSHQHLDPVERYRELVHLRLSQSVGAIEADPLSA